MIAPLMLMSIDATEIIPTVINPELDPSLWEGSIIYLNPQGLLAYSDGERWKPIDAQAEVTNFLTVGSTPFTPAPETNYLDVELLAGGAGGGSAQGIHSNAVLAQGGGGGAGAYANFRLLRADIDAITWPVNVTVGDGGVGSTDITTPASNAQPTSFDGVGVYNVIAHEGLAGQSVTAGNVETDIGAGGSGGAPLDPDLYPFDLWTHAGGDGGSSGGTSRWGAGGSAGADNNPGNDAVNYGAGGGGARAVNLNGPYAGGHGKSGAARITEYL
jgi:hypothetical protein